MEEIKQETRGRKKLNLDSETETLLRFWIVECKGIAIKFNSFLTCGVSKRHIKLALRKLRKEKKVHVALKRWCIDKDFFIEIKERYRDE